MHLALLSFVDEFMHVAFLSFVDALLLLGAAMAFIPVYILGGGMVVIIIELLHELYNGLRVLYYSRRLRLARNLGNTKEQVALLRKIAGIYDHDDKLDEALSYYEKSLNLTTNEKEKAATYNNIALLYGKKGKRGYKDGYQKAVEYFHKAIETSKRYGDYHDVSISKLNLGKIYREMKDYENAEKYLSESIEGFKEVGDKYWEAKGYEYLAWSYIFKGDKKTAKENFKRAYNLYESIGAEEDARQVLIGIDFSDK
jgi:tetratricopeptide (TPR) repeat protein